MAQARSQAQIFLTIGLTSPTELNKMSESRLPEIMRQHPLCDGWFCPQRKTCARWFMLADFTRRPPWPILANKAIPPHGKCALWVKIPSPHYPHKPKEE